MEKEGITQDDGSEGGDEDEGDDVNGIEHDDLFGDAPDGMDIG